VRHSIQAIVSVGIVLVVVLASAFDSGGARGWRGSLDSFAVAADSPTTRSESAALRILGPTRSGLPWHSGAWTGGRYTAEDQRRFGTWRGRPTDIATTYVEPASFAAMAKNTWSITTWDGFEGRLNYGLRLLPLDGSGSLATIASGKQDWVWNQIARNLRDSGRGNSIVRIAWESNLKIWRHHATRASADTWKRAFRRVALTMRRQAPDLKFEFGVNCGSGLSGSADRLAPLALTYPGDDVVDLVGCDTFDWWVTHADSDGSWSRVLHPSYGPGIQDVVDFARAHRKGASFG